ncbi:recombinase family protein [Chakrabartyella piscis]|uniref:recombinase family protein n=1 Tax=Chakrabartyella piscis TaxID=2918914 RepID=UPI0029584DD1|nr:recombinase family protein [Chakrabartyella piscis]
MADKSINGTSAIRQKEIFQIDATIKQETFKMRVAGYARVSSDSKDQLNSFAVQVRYYTNLIEENLSWEMVDIYADEGISGVSTEKRDDFNRMINDCRDGKIDRIVTKSTSRFSRNTLDSIATVRELKAIGVTVYFEKEGIDTAKLSGENLLTLYSLFAQEESVSMSKNMKKGARMRMQKGTYTPSNAPFGYRMVNRQYEIYEPEAEIIRRIFAEYLMGSGFREICKNFNAEGIPSRTNNVVWRKGAISSIIKNERYVGDLLLQKSFNQDVIPYKNKINKGELPQYYVKDNHEPIVSRIQYELANILLNERATTVKLEYEEYPFSGKIVCGECGGNYRRKITNHKAYWVCRLHDTDKKDCVSERIREDKITFAFIHMYNKLRKNHHQILAPIVITLNKVQEQQQRENLELQNINKKIATLTEQNHAMSGLLSRGILDSALFISKTDELKKELKDAKDLKIRLLGKLRKDATLEETENLIEILDELPESITEMNEEILNEIVEKVVAKDNQTIVFILKNGLTLTERM